MRRLTVTPLCPPTTGMVTEGAKDRFPSFSATKVEARTTSRVVTPKSLKRGSVRRVDISCDWVRVSDRTSSGQRHHAA